MSGLHQLRSRRVGLALSGGSVRGLAHLGVVKALSELGINPSFIAGTSAGQPDRRDACCRRPLVTTAPALKPGDPLTRRKPESVETRPAAIRRARSTLFRTPDHHPNGCGHWEALAERANSGAP